MRGLFRSLSLRIAGIIIIVEIITLTFAGVIYLNNFAAQVDSRQEAAVSLPGKLMNAGLLDFNVVNDADTVREVVGEDVRNALVVATNETVFFSSNPDFVGKDVHTLDVIDVTAFDRSVASSAPEFSQQGEVLAHVSPIYGPDGRTPRFFAYIEVGNSEAVAQKSAIRRLFIIGTIITVAVTSLVIFLMFNFTVLRRILDVVRTSKRVEDGDLAARVTLKTSDDEIGDLQRGVNSMVARLQNLVGTLEERVAERTRDLTVAADVSVQITTQLDSSRLLADVAERTTLAFGLYHVSIFLYDDADHTIKLKQGVGKAGEQMVAMGKQFKLSDTGLVPSSALTQQPKISNDVAREPNYFANPFLPETRSELAIPMMYRGMLIGVLDIQSEQINRFSDEDIRIMRTLAEQIAIAIRNSQLFEETKAAKEEAEKADTVKSAFLASMSHELRTPLNAIINFSKFLAKGIPGPVNDEQMHLISSIAESGQHLLNLINDVLDMSKIESGSLRLYVENNINLVPIIEAAIQYTSPLLAEKPVAIHQNIPSTLPLIKGDRKRLLQIFLNVLSNACKFTEEGTVSISTQQVRNNVIIAIRDTGAGIAPEDGEHVFTAFKQTDTGLRQGGGGTGLGMPICKKLVEAHGGNIWFESQVGVGTTFYVELPLQELPLQAEQETERIKEHA